MKNLNKIQSYALYFVLAVVLFYLSTENRKLKENIKNNDTEELIFIAKYSAVLKYQKYILIEVSDAEQENRKIEFKIINEKSGFNKLDSTYNAIYSNNR